MAEKLGKVQVPKKLGKVQDTTLFTRKLDSSVSLAPKENPKPELTEKVTWNRNLCLGARR